MNSMLKTKGDILVRNRTIREPRRSNLVTVVSVKNVEPPANAITVVKASNRFEKMSNALVASMSLDEMLEASKILDMGFKGETIPIAKSTKVKKYVGEVLQLNSNFLTRPTAKKMQQYLTAQIVEKNRETTDEEEAKRLYRAFMEED